MSSNAIASQSTQKTPRIVVQLGLSPFEMRKDFRSELRGWAAQSPLVIATKEENAELDVEPYWNLHLDVSDVEASWAALAPVIERFETPYRAKALAVLGAESSEFDFPPAIVIATGKAGWDDYETLHHTDPAASDR